MPIAQRIECRSPEPEIRVRFSMGTNYIRIENSLKTVLSYLDFASRKPSNCGETLVITESSRDLAWKGIVLELGSSPEFYPDNVCTPYFYFALDTGSGIDWKAQKNGKLSDMHNSPGQIWINPPFVPFTHSISEECHFIILAVEEKKFLQSSNLWKNFSSKEFQFLNTYNIEDPVLKHFIELFVMEMRAKSRNGMQYIDSLLSTFADYYIQNYSNYADHANANSNFHPKSRISTEEIEQVKKLVLEDLSEKITIDDLSAEIGMSKFHFLREFKKMTGETPYQFVLAIKLEKAKELLNQSDQSITEIALDLGFSDQSHFTKAFSTKYGISPKRYKSNNRQE